MINVQVPVHCKQVPWLFYTYQVITPVYIDSETNLDFSALKLCVCGQCKMRNRYKRAKVMWWMVCSWVLKQQYRATYLGSVPYSVVTIYQLGHKADSPSSGNLWVHTRVLSNEIEIRCIVRCCRKWRQDMKTWSCYIHNGMDTIEIKYNSVSDDSVS